MSKTQPVIVLATVPSNHTTGVHEIRQGRDNKIYCTCKGWKFSRKPVKTCAHLETFKSISQV